MIDCRGGNKAFTQTDTNLSYRCACLISCYTPPYVWLISKWAGHRVMCDVLCSEKEQADARNWAKGLLKVMSSFVAVGGEKNIRWDSVLSVRPEMRPGDMERQRKGIKCVWGKWDGLINKGEWESNNLHWHFLSPEFKIGLSFTFLHVKLRRFI